MTWSYHSVGIHRTMLLDRVRDDAFLAAITSTVKPGDIVLDFGAGAGILSLFAARAGATRVYAVERTETARLTRRIAARNGLAGRISVLQADMEGLEVPPHYLGMSGVILHQEDMYGLASHDASPAAG